MDGYDFQRGKWQDIPTLITDIDKLYARLVAKGKADKLTSTKNKIYAERHWTPATALIENNFIPALKKLNFFYIPAGLVPGPIFIFPQRDVEGNYTRAQSRPLYEITNKNPEIKPSKYRVMGVKKEDFLGPPWLGADPDTLEKIMKLGWVVLVEGPFDLLAVRALCPGIPSLCPLTKKIGEAHQQYLRMLGVRIVYLMFDNELGKPGPDGRPRLGAGNASMLQLKKEITSMEVRIILTTANDPSQALESLATALDMKHRLNEVQDQNKKDEDW